MLHAVAAAYGQRPSRLVGMDADGADSWAAYQFDSAVLARAVEAESEAAGKAKTGAAAGGGRLANQPVSDPSSKVLRKVKINPDGTW